MPKSWRRNWRRRVIRRLDGQQILAILIVFTVLAWASVLIVDGYMKADVRAESNRPIEVEGR